jgi:hypothetical protein
MYSLHIPAANKEERQRETQRDRKQNKIKRKVGKN